MPKYIMAVVVAIDADTPEQAWSAINSPEDPNGVAAEHLYCSDAQVIHPHELASVVESGGEFYVEHEHEREGPYDDWDEAREDAETMIAANFQTAVWARGRLVIRGGL